MQDKTRRVIIKGEGGLMCVCTYVCACVWGEGRGSIMKRRDDQLKKKGNEREKKRI